MGIIKPRPFSDYTQNELTDCVLAKVGTTYLVLRPAVEEFDNSPTTQELYAIYADTNDLQEALRILRDINGIED